MEHIQAFDMHAALTRRHVCCREMKAPYDTRIHRTPPKQAVSCGGRRAVPRVFLLQEKRSLPGREAKAKKAPVAVIGASEWQRQAVKTSLLARSFCGYSRFEFFAMGQVRYGRNIMNCRRIGAQRSQVKSSSVCRRPFPAFVLGQLGPRLPLRLTGAPTGGTWSIS